MMIRRITVLLILAGLLVAAGCSEKASDGPAVSGQSEVTDHLEAAVPSEPDGSLAQREPRAVGTTDRGKLLVIPTNDETIEQLGAPSCFGEAEDYAIEADYSVVFKDHQGEETVLALTEVHRFIAPGKEPIALQTLSFQGLQAVVIAPQYTDCHGVAFYLIGIDDSGAYPFTFVTEEGTSNSFSYAPNTEVRVVENELVVEKGQAAGSEAKGTLRFKPDLDKHVMRLVSS
ncbi:hypothetical protein PaecuDRAFT_4349 [Paenibacillus curdlanolyticus YK9]|uniref:Lipoprotein n=1 Tax=Paenibacillus curdlanolyticus YK9 TaxID=717606 RepID=E0IFA8_9BACL|nr:hypothetical protein [Paenibacillus curdlanolyticus]EFM08884.1 hypothetical protein PaecuDRAFT_4349 [Paenibacillus curdlanolyticus YK9]